MATVRLHWATDAHIDPDRMTAHVLDRYDLYSGDQLTHCGAHIGLHRITVPADHVSDRPGHFEPCPLCMIAVQERIAADKGMKEDGTL